VLKNDWPSLSKLGLMTKIFALKSLAVEIVNLNVIEPIPVLNIQPVSVPITINPLVLESIGEGSEKPCGHNSGTKTGGKLSKTATALLTQKTLKNTNAQKGQLIDYRLNPEGNDQLLQSSWEK